MELDCQFIHGKIVDRTTKMMPIHHQFQLRNTSTKLLPRNVSNYIQNSSLKQFFRVILRVRITTIFAYINS